MSDLILRSAAKAAVKKRLGTLDLFESRFNADIDAIPAVDAVPVVPARRVNVRELAGGFAGDWGFDCSVCGATLPESLPLCKMNCCPNCGAKFAQEDDDNELC